MFTATLALMLVLGAGMQDHKPDDIVEVKEVCPTIRYELRYGTPRNGVKRAVYPKGSRCMLRRSAAERLCLVQKRLEKVNLGLKIWDGYRPPSAQQALWDVMPDSRFVAPPKTGSKHNRGAAVDLTLVDAKGRELKMPTDFDTFSPAAHPNYAGGTEESRTNRDTLRAAMLAEGFMPDKNEWWHFNAPDWEKFAIVDVPLVAPSQKSP